MMTNQMQSFRLPTGEIVIRAAADETGTDGVIGLVGAFFKEEIVGFTFSLASAFSALWFLAG